MDISNKNIVISTHYLVYGAPQALKEYLINHKVGRLIFIAHPLYNDSSRSFTEVIDRGTLEKKDTYKFRFSFPFINYIWESLITFFTVIKEKRTVDIYFGIDPLNASVGIILKKIGKTKKIIYYTIDFSMRRFQNNILEHLYQKLDKFCLANSDETWNVSPRISIARERLRKLERSKFKHQKVVPIGVWLSNIKRKPFHHVKKHQLLFLGHLLKKQGVQLVLDAMPEIVKVIPDFHFLIVGGGEYEKTLKLKTKDLKLDRYVTFKGWIKERNKIDSIMSDSGVAIAMYDKSIDTFTYFADATKLKDYLSAGLPIVLTDVPYNAKDIEKHQCGIIVSYDKKSIQKAVISLMQNTNKLKRYRNNALSYIKKYDWNKIFTRAFSTLPS